MPDPKKKTVVVIKKKVSKPSTTLKPETREELKKSHAKRPMDVRYQFHGDLDEKPKYLRQKQEMSMKELFIPGRGKNTEKAYQEKIDKAWEAGAASRAGKANRIKPIIRRK